MRSQQQPVANPENLAAFRELVDTNIRSALQRVNDALKLAFKDTNGQHPSQVVFRVVMIEIDKIHLRLNPSLPDHFKNIKEIEQAFDAVCVPANIIAGIKALYRSQDKDINAEEFYNDNNISPRKKSLIRNYVGIVKKLAVQRYMLGDLKSEELIAADSNAQFSALSDAFDLFAQEIGGQFSQVFSTGNFIQNTEYGDLLASVTQDKLEKDQSLQPFFNAQQADVSGLVTQDPNAAVRSANQLLRVHGNIQVQIDSYNRACERLHSLDESEEVARLSDLLQTRKADIERAVADFNQTFAAHKEACLQQLDRELRELSVRVFSPPVVSGEDLLRARIPVYQKLEAYGQHLDSLTSANNDRVGVVSIEKLRQRGAEILDRMAKLRDAVSAMVERKFYVPASNYNKFLKQVAVEAEALATECGKQYSGRSHELWDAAANTVRDAFVKNSHLILSQEKIDKLLPAELKTVTDDLTRRLQTCQASVQKQVVELTAQANVIKAELDRTRQQYVAHVNAIIKSKFDAAVAEAKVPALELLTNARAEVAALRPYQNLTLRNPQEFAPNYQPQPKRPGFFRRHWGKLIAGGGGVVLGAAIGAFAGFFLAPVTFGLSVPLLAAIGAAVGGGLLGGVIGTVVGYFVDRPAEKASVPQRKASVAVSDSQPEPSLGQRSSSTVELLRNAPPGSRRTSSAPSIIASSDVAAGSQNSPPIEQQHMDVRDLTPAQEAGVGYRRV